MNNPANPTDVRFRGAPVFLSDAAWDGAAERGMSIYDIHTILVDGVDCLKSKRKTGTVERCSTFRKNWVKVVAVQDFHYATQEECWLITHVGKTERP